MAVMSKNQKDPDLPKRAVSHPGASILLKSDAKGDVTLSFSDGSEKLTMNRRDFLRVTGAAAATAAMSSAACRYPERHIVPYVDRPEEVRIGMTNQYASLAGTGPDQSGILVQTRAGRPFKLEGNPNHPINKGALSARDQASYLDLYDPDRQRTALRVQDGGHASPVSWEELDAEVIKQISEAGGGIRILTGAGLGPSTQALIDTITAAKNDTSHVVYEALGHDAALTAEKAGYGQEQLPTYRFDRADYIVSLGCDFLGTWLSPVEFTKQFSSRRNPDAEVMSRLITFEADLSLTGSNSDHRFRVRPDRLTYVALALANEIFSKHSPKGVPSPLVSSALAPFTVEAVAERLGGEITADVLSKVAKGLADNAGKSLVVAGGTNSATETGVALQSVVNLINAGLQNDGKTIERNLPTTQAGPGAASLKTLVDDIDAGKVKVLIIAGPNPVYTAPAALNFAAALEKVPFVISTSTHLDETAAHADLLATGVHYLERWADSNPRPGVYAIGQPAILPLYNNRSFEDSLLTWFGAEGQIASLAPFLVPEEAVPTGPKPGGPQNDDPGPFYRYLKNYWKEQIFSQANTLATFEQFWVSTLRSGVFLNERVETSAPRFNARAAAALFPSELPEATNVGHGDLGNKVIHLFESIPMGDGRQSNNGHLQELPDPITRHTWGSYAVVGYRTAEAAKLKDGQLLEIETADGTKINFPVLILPGVHEDVISIPVGYGRTAAGDVGSDVGENAFRLADFSESGPIYSGLARSIRATSTVEKLSVLKGAGVLDMSKRHLFSTATLDEYKENKKVGIYEPAATQDLWPAHDFGDLNWGMAIDLSLCTGCAACVIACQEENNVPVVGRQGILEGREMHWLRIDRYYKLPEEALEARTLFGDPMYEGNPQVAFGEYLDKPRILMHPMLCQHCDHAPCETVCPVLATMRSADGLNQMSYQRCVGTRYCSDNCPYKVRRFNWFNYSENRTDSFFARLYPELKEHGRLNQVEPLPLGFNPDVTVRSRGVMEKCTFCVQRIRRAKWEIMKEGRRTFRDGEVITACQQTCPADAITFGNMYDEEAEVAKQQSQPRAMESLRDLNTKPAISYLSSIWNEDEELA